MSAIAIPIGKFRRLEPSGLRSGPLAVSLGASTDADTIKNSLFDLYQRQNLDRPSARTEPTKPQMVSLKPLAEQLYDALANAKVMTSRVAMHLEPDWRNRLFVQLDDLLDIDDWHDDDKPVEGSSFMTFLRMIVHQKPQRRPGLGVSHGGHLIGAWTSGADRLTLEFLPNDMIRWVLSCEIDGVIERAAGETPVWRMSDVMRPYNPDRWFAHADHQPTA